MSFGMSSTEEGESTLELEGGIGTNWRSKAVNSEDIDALHNERLEVNSLSHRGKSVIVCWW
jgi:hypothetical protein